MAMAHADVTVVVPCYNGERYLDQCLASVERSDRCRLQVVCVNDGSTDGSLAIMREHAARDARVSVVDRPNGGYGAAVNAGLAEARGTYVAVAEADDYVLPHMYDDLFDLACAYGCPDVVKSCYWRVVGAGTPGERHFRGYVFGRIHPRERPFTIDEAPQLLQYHPSIWSGLYRREFLLRHGIRLVEAPGGGWVDNPFLVEALCQAGSILYTDSCYYCYREDISGTSTAARSWQVSYARWMERQDALERLGVTDEGVLRANCVVGLKFVEAALSQGVLDSAEGSEATRDVLLRMDPALVRGIADVSPGVIGTYARLTGHPVRESAVAYGLHLAGEALWGLRVNGPGFVAGNIALARARGGAGHGGGEEG